MNKSLRILSLTTFFTVLVVACSDQAARAKPNFLFKDAPRSGVLAKINGQEITEEELIGDAKLSFFDIKKSEYELRMKQLNALLLQKLVGAEAQKANLSLDEYINKKILSGDVKISEKEYNKFVAEKKIPADQINDQLKERINAYLKDQKKDDAIQAHIAKLTKSSPVEVYFKKPKVDIQVEVGDSPTFGSKDAKVTIVEFSDFECPFCGKAAATVSEIKKKYGDKVRVAFKHFPLPMHSNAKPASEASLCVRELNEKAFWKFHDTAFKNQQALDAANLEKYAKEAGVDVAKFKECVASKRFAGAVEKDLQYGEKLGVRSTPTFFVNGQLLSGALPIESFSEVIDEELEAAKGK